MALDSCTVYMSVLEGGATAALAKFRCVKLAAGRKFVVTAANDYPDGVLYSKVDAAGEIPRLGVADFRRSQSLRIEAGGGITDGDYVKADATGKVVTDGTDLTANSIGKAIGAYAAGEIAQILSLG